MILMYLEQMQHLIDAAAALERHISEHFSRFQTTLTSIPGVDPRVKQSGEMKLGGVHRSKRSSPYLRRAIWRASVVVVQHNPMFRAYYEKKAAEGMRYMNIIRDVGLENAPTELTVGAFLISIYSIYARTTHWHNTFFGLYIRD